MVFDALPVACGLGESPFWWPEQGALYWCDIPGRRVHRWRPRDGAHTSWPQPEEVGSIAPLPDGGLLLARRDGLFRLDAASGESERLAPPPYDRASQRFNDGKADPQGRFWVGTICEPRLPARGALYRWADDRLDRLFDGVSTSNGLAWSPDGRTLYWSDTQAHCIEAFDFDGSDGSLSRRRVLHRFAPKPADGSLAGYGGRPDGAAVDAEGGYWVALYEGARLLRLAPDGSVLTELALPVRCPTMPCFGGADLRTLYITTAAAKTAEQAAAEPLAGRVLALRVDVPGLPVNFVRA
ncbi:gluconolactonase [Rubrivivax gelatinosus]|uniref:Gluconolactonase n=1 Tax=Rubrivivax gelatinosus TaxID=28068 RepID=A0ABS1DRJ2_RUBGE|nr:SMP-30/gluconolactonase/LRE family protein [Rubrivivax gelatinosus]MBK1615446.1 gluconolactonase [Rubrivivax gelatinosus]MBK1712068.1 gluconolactonase [Rubrivivax gelatinosus]